MNYTQAQIDRANAVSLEDFLRRLHQFPQQLVLDRRKSGKSIQGDHTAF